MNVLSELQANYLLFGKLLARPAQRWWRSTGAVLTGLLLCVTVSKLLLEITPVHKALLVAIPYGQQISLRNAVLPCIALMIAACIWFLAAVNVKLTVASALEELPFNAAAIPPRVIFLHMSRQGIVPTVLLLCACLPISNYYLWEALLDPYGPMLSSTASEIVHSFAGFMLAMLWSLLLLAVTPSRTWLAAGIWLFALVLLPASLSLFQAVAGFGYIYTGQTAPLYFTVYQHSAHPVTYFVAWVAALLMLRQFAAGRFALGNAVCGLFIAGAVLSSLEKLHFSSVYRANSYQHGRSLSSAALGNLLYVGRFAQSIPLHQDWSLDEARDRLISVRVPIPWKAKIDLVPWHYPLVIGVIWIPVMFGVLMAILPWARCCRC